MTYRFMIKRIILGIIIGITLLLGMAALHDIVWGKELNYASEYGMLGISILIFGVVYYSLRRN